MSNSKILNPKEKIFLYGPSGSGKSTVGRILASNLNIPFIDLDNEIEVQSGCPIPVIFAQEGESGFREWEKQVFGTLLPPGECIVALGGGALTNPKIMENASIQGHIVLLTAPAGTLISRLMKDTESRPLLSSEEMGADKNLSKNLQDLLTHRADHYAGFPIRVDTNGMTPQDVAWQIQARLGAFHLKAMANKKHLGYDVRVQPRGLIRLGQALRDRHLRGPLIVVTDVNVGAIYLDQVVESLREYGYDTREITIPAGENHKTIPTVMGLWEAFIAAKIERGSTVVAMGGGVLGDLAGFAAATYLRGVPWVVVPTTLLAMVDSSLGGKTGADLPQGKNLIGAFYPPQLVLADPYVLQTLPDIELVNGMAEVFKHGVIAAPELFDLCSDLENIQNPDLQAKIVCQGMAVKVKFIEEDPFERGIRAALNYGHTVGHGVELASNYRLRHGEAVAIGMVMEARFAESIGLAKHGLADQIASGIEGLGLPVAIPPDLDREAIVTAIQRDKKISGGVMKFALPAAIGDVRVGSSVDGWQALIRQA